MIDFRTRAAVHESAHACMFMLMGVPIDVVHLDDTGGACRPVRYPSDPRDTVLACYAGAVAEQMVLDLVGSTPSDVDLDIAEQRCREAGVYSWEDRRQLRYDAEYLVARLLDQIEFLAAELHKVGCLTGADIGRLCRQANSPLARWTYLYRDLARRAPVTMAPRRTDSGWRRVQCRAF